MVMTSVNIARFKAQISRYIRAVRRGQEVVITDRNLPVARVVPVGDGSPFGLHVRRAVKDPAGLALLMYRPVRGKRTDSLASLAEERAPER